MPMKDLHVEEVMKESEQYQRWERDEATKRFNDRRWILDKYFAAEKEGQEYDETLE